ncbi:hypothetical protein EMPS_03000 [Entomortierella parvispora]|uniref:Uncharacterized protein n=1 Tax=Entomortierella parvispora TaxID=205924 RepID=A0A9P3H5U6_9FUNG|nr:hypothetical protein EMPS_03000 [Entomortierella parvispora]
MSVSLAATDTSLATGSASIISTASSPPRTSHPPPVQRHHDLQQPYNIHQRIRQPGQTPGGRSAASPSIRQSWFVPANRAMPSTSFPETTSVVTRTPRPSNTRSSISSPSSTTSTSASASAVSPSVPPRAASNPKERRNFSGSARSRLSKIDRLNRMTLNQNTSAPSLIDVSTVFPSPVSPIRGRINLQSPTRSTAEPPYSSSTVTSPSPSAFIDPVSSSKATESGSAAAASSTQSISHPSHMTTHSGSQSSNNSSDDYHSSSLPSTHGFPDGVDAADSDKAELKTEKASRHTSMPLTLLRPGWRLYDVPDTDDADSQYEFDPSGTGDEDRHDLFNSPSNASSTTNFEHYHPIHGRQDPAKPFYSTTPNASNLDLSLGSSNSIDSPVLAPADALFTGLNPPVAPVLNTKTSKNNGKSPLALKRSSTTSFTSASSPSNTVLTRGSLPMSSLSSTAIHRTKALTEERQKIILEILRTERSYVDGLIILQTLFYEPLNAPYASNHSFSGMATMTSLASGTGPYFSATSNSASLAHPSYYASSTIGSNSTLASSAAPLLSKKSVGEIFSNFSEILKINTLLLTQLENRICGATFSTGWESDEEEATAEREDEYRGEDREVKKSGRGDISNQVLVTVGSQGGEREELLVLDEDWCVGDIFIEIAPFLKMYSSYVKTYTTALAHINDCMKSNERFTDFIKTMELKPECKSLGFQSYLMLPVQRIPRYRMLLESLLRHTPAEHPDHRMLRAAFESMEVTASFVNETIRQHEMFREMLELQSKLTGLSEPLVIPGRVLLKKGEVWKICRRNVQLRRIFLFSDCILWTSPSLNPLDATLALNRKVGLENCTVIGADDPDPTKHAFQIISPEKSSQVYVDTLREKEDWMNAIRRATSDYLSAKRTLKITITPFQSISAAATNIGAGLLRRETLWSPTLAFVESKSRSFGGGVCVDPEIDRAGSAESTAVIGWHNGLESSHTNAQANAVNQKNQQPLRVIEIYNAPVWIPNQSATRCMICLEEFGTLMRWKHHCRVCGKVVCHDCSTRSIVMKGTHSEKTGRACDDCIETMFPEEGAIHETQIVSSAIQDDVEGDNNGDPPHHSRQRDSYHSLDGVFIRPEDCPPDTPTAASATGMVRGFVEAGLNRMKSRSGAGPGSQDLTRAQNDTASKENTRGRNRRSLNSAGSNGSDSTKACGLCKTEFGLFKWKYVCQQCHRTVCADCLTKKQIDPFFLLGLQAEREAKAMENRLADLSVHSSPTSPSGSAETSSFAGEDDSTKPKLIQSESDGVLALGSSNTGSGNVRRGGKGKTDSGLGQAERLCDPCYLGLSSDQVKVLESGGGWQYYQATLGKQTSHGLAAALAVGQDDFDQAEDDKE